MRTRCTRAIAPSYHRSARVPCALGCALASRHDIPIPARSPSGAAHGERAASCHALSKELVEGVAQRTGGVPLFVEEVTRLLLERGEQGGTQAIPPTLQHSLMARLDRLGPAREVAQIGAVIGRDFSYALIRTVAGTDELTLQTALERLAEADILLVQGEHGTQLLLQARAYTGCGLREFTQELASGLTPPYCRSAARNLTGHENQPALIAHHFAQAGQMEEAIEWWGKAGQRSLERSAFVEAVKHFQLGRLPNCDFTGRAHAKARRN